MNKVRTRFAPSPTGFLHVGGVRTALFAWLVARQARGDFILRIEDTDKSREVAQSEKHIKESLSWLGLQWDEGPYRQSERLDLYKEWGQKLVEAGRAYADPYTPQQLTEFRDQAVASKKPFLFREHRPEKPPHWDGSKPLRFKSEPQAYKWRDEVLGELSTGPEVVDDFILIKSDGYPTYNFAHIVDDHLMNISHVIRSQEFLASVPKFLNLYEALDIERPKLATLPYVMGPDGKRKLSKRDGAKDVLDYKKLGYLPEALVNFLATLGWNDGSEQEIFSVDELIDKFSLDRVHHGGARFDEARLAWMNGHYIRELSLDELFKKSQSFWPPEAENASDNKKMAVLALVQERIKYLAELPDLTHIFFEAPEIKVHVHEERDPKTQKAISLVPKDQLQMLKTAIDELEKSDFTEKDLIKRLNGLLDSLDTSPSVLFESLRIAIAGGHHTPPLSSTLSVLGKEESLRRIKKSIS